MLLKSPIIMAQNLWLKVERVSAKNSSNSGAQTVHVAKNIVSHFDSIQDRRIILTVDQLLVPFY